jgi:hypothetical protein
METSRASFFKAQVISMRSSNSHEIKTGRVHRWHHWQALLRCGDLPNAGYHGRLPEVPGRARHQSQANAAHKPGQTAMTERHDDHRHYRV